MCGRFASAHYLADCWRAEGPSAQRSRPPNSELLWRIVHFVAERIVPLKSIRICRVGIREVFDFDVFCWKILRFVFCFLFLFFQIALLCCKHSNNWTIWIWRQQQHLDDRRDLVVFAASIPPIWNANVTNVFSLLVQLSFSNYFYWKFRLNLLYSIRWSKSKLIALNIDSSRVVRY